MLDFQRFICILLALTTLCAEAQGSTVFITQDPLSLLIPTGLEAEFTCSAYCTSSCDIDWIVGDIVVNPYHQNRLEQEGYQFFGPVHVNGTYTARLIVITTALHNNTVLRCYAILNGANTLGARSLEATLIVIADSPASPNPSVTFFQANTSTSFKLQFSPPFLWPGYRIKHYNITITNLNSAEVIYYTIMNATFGDAVVVYTQVLDPGVSCAKLMFLISALSRHDDILESFNTTIDQPGIAGDFMNSSISTLVYFNANITPTVRMDIQLPSHICAYQELNYSLSIDGVNGSSVVSVGPIYHLGSGHVRHEIATGLTSNEVYSVGVNVETDSYTLYSHPHMFDTYFQDEMAATETQACKRVHTATSIYSSIIGICVGVICVVASLLVAVILYKKKTGFKCVRHASNGVLFQSVIINPVYVGSDQLQLEHMYDSVHSQTHLQNQTVTTQQHVYTQPSNVMQQELQY